MPHLRKILIALAVGALVSTGMLAAQTEPTEVANAGDVETQASDLAPSPKAMRASSAAVLDELRGRLARFAELRQLARDSKDVLKLNCVNDAMLLFKQVVNLAEDARVELLEALDQSDSTGRDRSYAQVADAGRRGLELRRRAEACIGAELMFVGPPRLDVSGPGIDELDLHGWFDLDDPKYATPFN